MGAVIRLLDKQILRDVPAQHLTFSVRYRTEAFGKES